MPWSLDVLGEVGRTPTCARLACCADIADQGLTGLSISHSLSLASVDHVVIGRRPELSPRLGESLNLDGTLLLWEMFPQLSRFFFPKREVLGYLGDYEVMCDFAVSQRAVSRAIFRTLLIAPDSLPHSCLDSIRRMT